MPSQIFPFDSITNYTPSDSNKIGVSGGNATLKLQNDPDNDFNEDFADDTDFTYNSDEAEFSAGQVQQKNVRPANATFYAPFTVDEDAAWSDGDGSGTLVGGATVGSGELNALGASGKYCTFDADSNVDFAQILCIRMRFKTGYTGTPAAIRHLINVNKGDGTINNLIQVYHQPSGILSFGIYNDSGGAIFNANIAGWSPVTGTPYEFEFNIDITNGATRLFINGTQAGSTITSTGTRNSSNINELSLGSNHSHDTFGDYSYMDVLVFDSIQHTTDYTPDWSNINEYDYIETEVVLPEMEYTGAGALVEATNFVTSETGSPRFAVQIGQSGDYLYWDGAQWGTNDDTYAQANDAATFLANISTLPVDGEVYGQFKIYFTNSNSQSAVADLTITLTAQIYPTDNPYLDINSRWYLDDLEALTEGSPVTNGSDEIKYILKQGSTWYYHDGSDWAESDGTYSQANTAAEITTYKSDFTDSRIYFAVRVFLHSADGSTTPTLGTLTIQYSYAGETPDTINECLVVFDGNHSDTTPGDDTIIIYPINNHVKYKDKKIILKKYNTVTLDDSGYGEVSLVENENMEGNQGYVIQWSKIDKEYVVIPNEATKYYNDLVEWEEA